LQPRQVDFMIADNTIQLIGIPPVTMSNFPQNSIDLRPNSLLEAVNEWI